MSNLLVDKPVAIVIQTVAHIIRVGGVVDEVEAVAQHATRKRRMRGIDTGIEHRHHYASTR